MVLIDTNVLVDVLQNDPQWADWSIRQLRARSPRRYRTYFPSVELLTPEVGVR